MKSDKQTILAHVEATLEPCAIDQISCTARKSEICIHIGYEQPSKLRSVHISIQCTERNMDLTVENNDGKATSLVAILKDRGPGQN